MYKYIYIYTNIWNLFVLCFGGLNPTKRLWPFPTTMVIGVPDITSDAKPLPIPDI